MPEDRRHIAVMFTDIVGYTALMGSDEDKAFDMLKLNHTIHATLIKKHNGKIIKEVGDGTLASFPLASDAVRCAMNIQKETKSQNIPLKIGIHEGEMVMAGEDVLGDGVNIASRLQEASKKGCITISGKVYSDIRNKAGIKTKLIGHKRLKNVADPVKVYEVLCEEEKTKPIEREEVKSKFKRLYYILGGIVVVLMAVIIWQLISKKEKSPSSSDLTDKTIAVIPFWNDSSDPDNAYFCSGMEEDIRVHLLKIADLKIESRQSVEKYRENPEIDATTIGNELGVAYIVEGSVQKLENDVRVRVQLIDAKTGDHIWAEIYDGDYTIQLLEFQSNTAKQIASSLNAIITPEEEQKFDILPTTDMRAYDFYLKGLDMLMKYWGSFNDKYSRSAHNLLDKALEIDPTFVDAVRCKGDVFMAERKYDSALIYIDKAIINDPENPYGYQSKAECFFSIGDYDHAIEYYNKAISLSPKDKWIGAYYGLVRLYVYGKNDPISGLQIAFNSPKEFGSGTNRDRSINDCFMYLGDFERAEEYTRKEINSRIDCGGVNRLAQILFKQAKYAETLHFLDSICGTRSCLNICYRNRFLVNLFQKEIEQAYDDYGAFIEAGGTLSLNDNVYLGYMYQELGQEQKALEILSNTLINYEKLGYDRVYVTLRNIYKAAIYTLLHQNKEALMCLSDAINTGLVLGWDVFLPLCPLFENLWDNPEFKVLVQRAQDEKAAIRTQVQEMVESGEIEL